MKNTKLTAREIDHLIEDGTFWEHAIYDRGECYWRRGKRARRVKASLQERRRVMDDACRLVFEALCKPPDTP